MTTVNFDEFRIVVRASRNKALLFEYESGKFGLDHCLMRTLNMEWSTERVEDGNCSCGAKGTDFSLPPEA